jgi:hypothetical protein
MGTQARALPVASRASRARGARWQQEGHRSGTAAPQGWRDVGRGRQGRRLAEPQHPGLHLRHSHEEDGHQGREHEKRCRRAVPLNCQVGRHTECRWPRGWRRICFRAPVRKLHLTSTHLRSGIPKLGIPTTAIIQHDGLRRLLISKDQIGDSAEGFSGCPDGTN